MRGELNCPTNILLSFRFTPVAHGISSQNSDKLPVTLVFMDKAEWIFWEGHCSTCVMQKSDLALSQEKYKAEVRSFGAFLQSVQRYQVLCSFRFPNRHDGHQKQYGSYGDDGYRSSRPAARLCNALKKSSNGRICSVQRASFVLICFINHSH